MRARLVVLALVLGFAAVQLTRESGRAVAPVPGERATTQSAAATPHLAPTAAPAPFRRDPFRFADDEPAPHTGRTAPRAVVAPPSPDPAPGRVRLVGLVRRGGVLRAALSVEGEIVLASPGDSVGGLVVLSLDDEAGVRVRDPEGLEMTLSLPEEP
jgi:hypothetical protein